MTRSVFALCALALALLLPGAAYASDMDLALARLRNVSGVGGCPAVSSGGAGIYCPNNALFERLVSELAVTVALPVSHGAASLGPRGFYFGLSSTVTPISATQFYWTHGTVGDVAGASANTAPDAALFWNRLEVRKGLPFGFEAGSSIGQGADTSMWLFAGELKWALFEGFHSGAGRLPDLAVRGTMQTLLGSRQLSLQTNTLDVTLSKPFVVADRYRVTPFAAFQVLLMRASTGRVDLTPTVDAFANCAPSPAVGSSATAATGSNHILQCTAATPDTANYATFDPVSHTRTRVFLGVEGSERWWTSSASFGIDISTPAVKMQSSSDGFSTGLPHQFSFHLSLGLRY